MTKARISTMDDGVYAAGGVVGLRIRKRNGTIRYLMRWTRHGVRHDYYLPRDISLTEARKLGAECRYQLDRGEDPRVEHKRREVEAIEKLHKLDAQKSVYLKTFRNVAVEWFEYQRSINAWANNEKGERTAYLRLRKHVYPLIGNRVIQELGVEDAVKVLTPVWKSKNSADKIYQLLRRVFEFAIIKKYYVGVNPIDKRGSLGVLLQPLTLQRTAGENMAALPYERVPDLMCALLNNGTNSALAVAFSILTASRFRAVRLSEWSECELDGEIPLWRIPPEHDKNKGRGIRHIPLSPQALVILQKMKPRKHDKSSFIFPSVRGLALCDSVPSTLFRSMSADQVLAGQDPWVDPLMLNSDGKPKVATQHGTARASFKSWAKSDRLGNFGKYSEELIEACLLHSIRKRYNGAYDRSTFDLARYQLFCSWGEYCFSRLGE